MNKIDLEKDLRTPEEKEEQAKEIQEAEDLYKQDMDKYLQETSDNMAEFMKRQGATEEEIAKASELVLGYGKIDSNLEQNMKLMFEQSAANGLASAVSKETETISNIDKQLVQAENSAKSTSLAAQEASLYLQSLGEEVTEEQKTAAAIKQKNAEDAQARARALKLQLEQAKGAKVQAEEKYKAEKAKVAEAGSVAVFRNKTTYDQKVATMEAERRSRVAKNNPICITNAVVKIENLRNESIKPHQRKAARVYMDIKSLVDQKITVVGAGSIAANKAELCTTSQEKVCTTPQEKDLKIAGNGSISLSEEKQVYIKLSDLRQNFTGGAIVELVIKFDTEIDDEAYVRPVVVYARVQ